MLSKQSGNIVATNLNRVTLPAILLKITEITGPNVSFFFFFQIKHKALCKKVRATPPYSFIYILLEKGELGSVIY